ncbi:C40 family peptidase [Clostridium formicaceticum]|uniref:Glycoside hydrolase n=1 Tax=Clostridium formicaceticum TaxID=1497 RepID=A0AAC9RIX4_9CLOT|nr:NlpC/P60 family protein [Clostridium formicaceticum]AOY76237.1 glycoside hydrolase [Clostridium formicaceticum]ARE86617.1 outer membrane lipoprotein [Clostridium formicaceticum]
MNENMAVCKIEDLINRFRNVPFIHNGRSLEKGIDCLGLVILVYREFGINLPSDDGMVIEKNWYKKDPERLIRGIRGLGGIDVDINELQLLDLVYFAINRDVITHTGVMINRKEFIHIRPIIGFSKDNLEGRWKRRFKGAIRLRQ